MSRGARLSASKARALAERIARAGDFTSESMARARAAVSAMEGTNEAHARALSSLAEVAHVAASRARGASTLTQVAKGLVRAICALVDRLRDRGSLQEEAATRAAQSAGKVACFATEVSKVAAAARILALNANIAASRLGHTGLGAAVISTRFHAFAGEMQAEVGSLVELSRELAEVLPTIAARSADVRAASDAFCARASSMIDRVEGTRDLVEGKLGSDVVACERRVAAMARLASDIATSVLGHDAVDDLLTSAAQRAGDGDGDGTIEALEGAIAVSLAHISPASDGLASLNGLAQEQVDALRALAALIQGDGDVGGPARALASVVDGFVSDAREHIAEQRRAVALAIASEGRRGSAAEACRALVMEARMLTLAVRVEAGRLGAAGVDIVPIAEQLGAFTANLDRVVRDAATSTGVLRGLLAQIQRESKVVSDAVEAFAVTAPRERAALEKAVDDVAGGVCASLEASRDRAKELLDASHELITCLQFQDRLTQEARSLSEAARSAAAAVPDRSFLDAKHEDGLSAGDLMLF